MTAVSPLDRPIARVVAGACFLVCVGILVYMHRDDLFQQEAVTVENTVLGRCIAERTGQVDAMRRDELIDDAKAELFRQRAVALCNATHRQN